MTTRNKILNLFKRDGTPVNLDASKEIARGGEGMIIPIGNSKKYVAKIYHDNTAAININKFKYLTKLNGNFVKPLNVLFDDAGIMAGFVMEYLKQDYFPLDAVFTKFFCAKNNITTNNKRKLTQNLIDSVNHAHSLDIVIGDLSGLNIHVNKSCDIKFVDVDSYQTPTCPHSGKQLEIIRDFLYNGKISKESDYFALAVIVFNYLTYVHPFKGIHKIFQRLADRVTQKIPVFTNDSDHLIVPKCYEPINNKVLMSQFERIFVKGERFMLSLTQVDALVSIKGKVKPVIISEKDLVIQKILDNQQIENVCCSINLGVVKTKDKYIILKLDTKGFFTQLKQYDRNEYDDVYVGKKNIVCRKNNSLYCNGIQLSNIIFSHDTRFYQIDDILLAIQDEVIYWVYLDSIISGIIIKIQRLPIYGAAIKLHRGFIQHIDGKQYIYCKCNDILSTIQSPNILQAIYQCYNVGIAQYVEKEQIKYKYFNIDKLNMRYDVKGIENFRHFAYQQDLKNTFGLIYEPRDNELGILRGSDFQEISNIKCSLMSEATNLIYTQAGLIAWDANNVYLINKK